MSLCGFHIFFISLITLVFALVAGWGWTMGIAQDALFWEKMALVSTITAVIAPVYGIYFISKSKKLYT